jgi:hypothetical protein
MNFKSRIGKSRIGMVAATAMVLAVGMGAGRFAAAAGLPVPSGNLNLRLNGYEVVTSESSTTPARLNIDAIGQVIADTKGNLSGAETFNAVDPTVPAEEVCKGTVSGTITPPTGGFGSGDGEFSLSLSFAPTSTGAYCIPATTTMQCNRSLLHKVLVDDLDAGQYHCIVTGMTVGTGATSTIDAASMDGHLDSARGSNALTD